jgi:3-deoxy-D-manno-octulosonic-acid transferase
MNKIKTSIYSLFSALLYQAGIQAYALLAGFAALFNKKAALMVDGQKQSFSIIQQKIIPGESYIWFHAASLGEFEQGRPVMEVLKRQNPATKILLTFFSPSGYEIRKQYTGADIIIYLPFDTRKNAEKLLQIIPISKAIFIKYEFWPNYLQALKKKNIPFYSVAAIFRHEQLFFKSYGQWYLNILKDFTHIFVQDENSSGLLKTHLITQHTIAGDTRFDRVLEIAAQAKEIPLIEKFASNSGFVLIAGSSWPADETLLIQWMKENPESKLIIVPHEIHDAHIQSIMKQCGEDAIRFTEANNDIIQTYRCLILDTMGMLSSVYRYGNLAYVGGGFGVGIHNITEAAVWQIPVIFGPNYHKFREAKDLIALQGAISVSGYEAFLKAVQHFKNHPESGEIAAEYVRKNGGATEKILQKIQSSTKE